MLLKSLFGHRQTIYSFTLKGQFRVSADVSVLIESKMIVACFTNYILKDQLEV